MAVREAQRSGQEAGRQLELEDERAAKLENAVRKAARRRRLEETSSSLKHCRCTVICSGVVEEVVDGVRRWVLPTRWCGTGKVARSE